MFPEVFIELQKEVLNHPTLVKQLNEMDANSDLGDRIGTICAYCGIVLEGMYDQDQIEELAGICIKKLKQAIMELVEDISKPVPPVTTSSTLQ